MSSLLARRAGPIAAILVAAGLVQACSPGEDPGFQPPPPTNNDASAVVGNPLSTGDAGSSAIPNQPATGDAGALQLKDGGTGAQTVSTGLPCDVQKIVAAKCAVGCHSDPPVSTYMTLTKQSVWQETSTSDKTKKYFELAKTRVNSADRPMPPITHPALTADEKTKLNAWLMAGAPASTDKCEPIVAAADAGVPKDGTEVDVSGLECYKFLAHAQGDKKAKYKVGTAVDKYMFFGFQAPWQGTAYGLVVKPVIDNSKALHHWLLYKEQVADGSVTTTIGQHSGGELIHGWAPGGIAMDFRKHGDVSFEMPSTTYGLELHYNSSDPNAMDASGAEICITKTPTKNIASMSWVGYDQGGIVSYGTGICFEASTSWVGTCKPTRQEPIHLIFMTPHLHQAGRHLKSVINGPKGSRILHDKAFDFNYQTTYETDEILMPGESITTTCTYSEPKCAGQSTSQEMCYNFIYSWPKHALTDNGPEGAAMHGEGVCLGQ